MQVQKTAVRKLVLLFEVEIYNFTDKIMVTHYGVCSRFSSQNLLSVAVKTRSSKVVRLRKWYIYYCLTHTVG
jgi:hypothetical protein